MIDPQVLADLTPAGDGTRRVAILQALTEEEVVALVLDGVVPLEALNDEKRSGWKHPAHQTAALALQDRHTALTATAAFAQLEEDVGIAVCLAGIEDPEAAAGTLGLEGDAWVVEDGYLFARGVTSADLAQALTATR